MAGIPHTESVHAKQRTDASADEGNEEKGGFRDAPDFAPRTALVDSHGGKSGYIYYYTIKD